MVTNDSSFESNFIDKLTMEKDNEQTIKNYQ